MPIYEFQCRGCGQIDEIMCSIKEAEKAVIKCEICETNGLVSYFRRITSAVRGIVRNGASPTILKQVKNADKSR